MPIFTLCSKSMPSTYSRKPCTKCWRDCSPSEAMSMPASSCSFSHSNVASRLAFSRSAPSARQVGQSLFVSASQPGLGRLPAMVVSSIENSPFHAHHNGLRCVLGGGKSLALLGGEDETHSKLGRTSG